MFRPLPGTISYVSPTANNQPGAVTYDVRIGVEAPRGIELRSGPTAVAEVVPRSETNVLLIPLQALREDLDQPMVLTWEDGVAVEKLITTGSSDGFWVVVKSGLSEGDAVVTEGSPRRTCEDGRTLPETPEHNDCLQLNSDLPLNYCIAVISR